MKKSVLFYAAILLLGAAGCRGKDPAANASDGQDAAKLVSVANGEAVQLPSESIKLAGITFATAKQGEMSTEIQPTGEISATDSGTVQVTPRLPGKITQTFVNVGDHVQKGQLLAEIDSVDLAQAEGTYETAVSHETLAKNQLDQQKKLAGYGSLSEQPVEDARRAAVAADAAVASDQAQIGVDKLAMQSTRQLVDMGEITRKPLEDAQNNYAQAVSAASQADTTLRSAKASLDRANILFDGGIYSRQQLEDAQTAYDTAEASKEQSATAKDLAKQELDRQQSIFDKNLNGASSLQGAQAKLQQDQHTYQNDVVAQGLSHKEYQRALAVRNSGIPVSQALQQARDTYDEAVIAAQAAANTIKLYGVTPGSSAGQLKNGQAIIPITAPLDGIVADRSMVVGQNVDTSTNIVRLINLDRVYVDAQVYEKDLEGVKRGDPVDVTVSAVPGQTFKGYVQLIASEINPNTRSVTVRTILQNPGWTLRPGMFASVQIGNTTGIQGAAIPAGAILQEGDKNVAYVQVSPDEFVKRTLTLGPSVGDEVAVKSGLSPGDKVVVTGNVLIEKEQDSLESEKSGA